MEWNRIFGLLFSSFMTKVYAAAIAIWIAYEAATFVTEVLSQVQSAL